jgi:hypothetical protein
VNVKLKDGNILEGDKPIVIIGPNGAGKTTYGNELANLNNAEWIGATRNLQFENNIPVQTQEQAISTVESQKQNQKSQPWMLSTILNQLLTKLKAEDAEFSTNYCNNLRKGIQGELKETKLITLTRLWNEIFPRRVINFDSYSPTVTVDYGGRGDGFGISRLSEGERVALYLLARVLDASLNMIVVDETELHFHSLLAREFWDKLERYRDDCRFIYITHDLSFALSRHEPTFIIIKDTEHNYQVESFTDMPDSIIKNVLGAATLSVTTEKIVFCEGERSSIDYKIFSRWFNSDKITVIPVESCETVIKCVDVVNNGKTVKGAQAIGIIDKDFHSDKHIKQIIKSNTYVLTVHEVESLLILPEVFLLVALKKGFSLADAKVALDKTVLKIKDEYNQAGNKKSKVIIERFAKNFEYKNQNIFNKACKSRGEIALIKSELQECVQGLSNSFTELFETESELVINTIKSADITEIFKILPGKNLLGEFSKIIKCTIDEYTSIVVDLLESDDIELRNIFNKYLPDSNNLTFP